MVWIIAKAIILAYVILAGASILLGALFTGAESPRRDDDEWTPHVPSRAELEMQERIKAARARSAERMITFACDCGEPYHAMPAQVGRTIHCWRCGRSLLIVDTPPPPPERKSVWFRVGHHVRVGSRKLKQ
jgi:hypothetical protein